MNDPTQPGSRRRPSPDEILAAMPARAPGHEARVGIFVIFGLLAFMVVLFAMTDPATLRGRYLLSTTVVDAGGIRRGDPIQMHGVNIGRVHGFHMTPDGRVAISMEVDGEWKIPADSRTRLGSSGIFGGRTLEVEPGSSSEFLPAGAEIPGEGGSANPLGSVAEMGKRAGDVLERIQTLLDSGTVASVRGSAGQLDTLLTEFSRLTREQKGAIKRLTESLANSAEGLESAAAAGPDAARAIARADSAMAALTRTGDSLEEAAAALRSVLERMDRGEGTLGRLATDESLYDNLSRAADQMATLLADLQAHPKKYINVSIF